MTRLLATLVSALFTILAFYPHYLNGWFVALTLVPLFVVILTSKNIYEAAIFAAVWGFIVYGAGLSVVLTLHPLTWAGIPFFLSGVGLLVAWILFTAYFTFFLAALAALIHFYRQHIILTLVITMLGWVSMEYIQSLGPIGLTINSLALTQLDTPFAYLSSIGGLEMVSLALITINIGIAVAILLVRTRYYEDNVRYNATGKVILYLSSIGLAVVVLIFSFAYSTYYAQMQEEDSKKAKKVVVSALQTDIPQEIKWSENTAQLIKEQMYHLAKRASTGAVLAITPETAFPMGIEYSPELLSQYSTLAASKKINYLVGSAELDNGYRNRAVLIGSSGAISHYDKDKLVVFGEYTPFRQYIPDFLAKIVLGYDDFISGGHIQEPVKVPNNDISVATMICLEAVYLNEPIYQIGRGADIIAIMTNDGWYKGSGAVFRHMEIANYHAIAHHRSVVFVSNRGPSAIISSDGKIVVAKPFEDVVISGSVEISKDKTLYDMGGYLFGLIILVVLVCVLSYEYLSVYALSGFEILKKRFVYIFSLIRALGIKAKKSKLHKNEWGRKESIFSRMASFIGNIDKNKKFQSTKLNKNKWKNKK